MADISILKVGSVENRQLAIEGLPVKAMHSQNVPSKFVTAEKSGVSVAVICMVLAP